MRSVAPSTASRSRGPALIIDGANVAYSYGCGRAASGFDLEGVRRCVDYFCARRRGVSLSRNDICVTLSSSRNDPSDATLAALEQMVSVCWTPLQRDDDVFTIQCADDHGSWVVTNDKWRDHGGARHASEALRRRRIEYAWMGGAFAPAADDLARFDARGGGG